MKKRLKTIVLVLCAGAVLWCLLRATGFGIMAWPTNDRDNRSPAKKREMLALVLKSGELEPVPSGATIRTIETEGNVFTRGFRLVFEADADSIDDWLSRSKGVKAAARVIKAGNTTRYILQARCGLQHAEVKVDHHRHVVTIYVSKS